MGLIRMVTDHSSLLLLLNWMSPTFPIGAFAYSHGLEQAIVDGRVSSAADVEEWIAELLQHGSGWNDSVLFAQCWSMQVDELNALALALAGSAERYMETTHLGRNFNIAASVWTGTETSEMAIAYPIAAGQACMLMGIDQQQALVAYLQGYCSALVSVAVRLVPLGQTNGLVVMRNLAPVVSSTAAKAVATNLDGIGTSCIAAEISAMRHETLPTRVFRT
jgi:urease accessory protein